MVQSPSWAANWFAASQEIPRISRNPKVHYRTHKLLPPVTILGQPNPFHTPTTHLLEIYPNIIHPSKPRSPQWSLTIRFQHTHPSPTPRPYTPHSLHTYSSHAQPISFFSILSPAQYWVRGMYASAQYIFIMGTSQKHFKNITIKNIVFFIRHTSVMLFTTNILQILEKKQ